MRISDDRLIALANQTGCIFAAHGFEQIRAFATAILAEAEREEGGERFERYLLSCRLGRSAAEMIVAPMDGDELGIHRDAKYGSRVTIILHHEPKQRTDREKIEEALETHRADHDGEQRINCSRHSPSWACRMAAILRGEDGR